MRRGRVESDLRGGLSCGGAVLRRRGLQRHGDVGDLRGRLRQRGVLAIVCDGMGGHEAGEVASALALETIVKRLDSDEPHLPDDLVHAVEAANRAIFETARANPRMRGMGTTCCTLVLHNGAAYCAHVGDSRCYLLRGDQLFLMTEDHSAVMELVRRGIISRDEARNHPDKNVISRALGSHKEVEVSTWSQPFSVQLDDTFLLCSDGLYDLVDDEQIRLTIGGPAQHVQVACDRLVALARQNGGHDNISVAILRMRAAGEGDAVGEGGEQGPAQGVLAGLDGGGRGRARGAAGGGCGAGSGGCRGSGGGGGAGIARAAWPLGHVLCDLALGTGAFGHVVGVRSVDEAQELVADLGDRKSTRLNSSH